MGSLKELQSIAKEFTILYVEDNQKLRENAAKLLKKFFHRVDLAQDGEEGLAYFKKYQHPIVITDLKMPKMDGITLLGHIKKIQAGTKTIIMSAFDDKEMLFKGIELGIFRFLRKPVSVTELADVLGEAIVEIKKEHDTQIFYSHLEAVFEYQGAMVVMLNESDIVVANTLFLDFFRCESIDDAKKEIGDLSIYFLHHDGFLYNHEDIDVFTTIKENENRLFHVKLKDKKHKVRHFLLKYVSIPQKEGYGILSFDDITELNLLSLFDKQQEQEDEKIADTKALFELLEAIGRNSAKVELHNYYKGLSVTNSATIIDISDDTITIKTQYIQQKAMQMEKKTYLVSEALPYVVECSSVEKMSFEKQSVVLKDLHFVKSSPVTRNTIRVVPQGKQNVSLFLGKNKFNGDIEIEDISLDAIRVRLSALPAGLDEESDVTLDIVLELDKKPLIINTKAKMLRKSESRHSFTIVFVFKDLKKSNLVKYISKRQMALIREIKGMQNG